MATRKITARRSRSSRASQRLLVAIDLANNRLRQLMTEQWSGMPGYGTLYRGSRASLVAAGVPETAFPGDGRAAAHFQVQTLNACSTGSQELLSGSMRWNVGSEYELQIEWGAVRPYVQASHPAIAELARLLLKDLLAWTGTQSGSAPELAHPMNILAADWRADDCGAPHLQVTHAFLKRLRDCAGQVFELVHTHGVVLPRMRMAAEQPRGLRLVVDNTSSEARP